MSSKAGPRQIQASAESRPPRPRGRLDRSVDDEAPERDDLTELLANVGGDASGFSVRLERLDARGEPEYLGTLPLTADLLDVVRDEHGGGKYRGRVVDGDSRYRQRIRFAIAGLPILARSRSAPAEGAPTSRVEVMLERTLEAVGNLAKQMQAPRGDDVEKVVSVARALKELTPTPPPVVQGASILDTIALFDRFLELREKVAEDAAPPTAANEISSAIRETVQPLAQIANRHMDIREREIRRPSQGQPQQPAQPSPRANDPIAAFAMKLPRVGIDYLTGLARSNADPEEYVTAIFQTIGDRGIDELAGLLQREDFAAVLCEVVPPFRPYPGWIAELADAMRGQIQPAGVEESDAAGDLEPGPDESPAAAAVTQ
jgi:hypothetical protein